MPFGGIKTRHGEGHFQPGNMKAKYASRASVFELQRRKVVTRQLGQRQASDSTPDEQHTAVDYFAGLDIPSKYEPSTTSIDLTPEHTLPNVDETENAKLSQPSDASPSEGKIDIQSAINLIQQFRKNASPAELTLLYKALLPALDSPSSASSSPENGLPTIEGNTPQGSVPPARRTSSLPPGLATRSGELDDILRRPPMPTPSTKSSQSRKSTSPSNRETWVHSAVKPISFSDRPTTPSDQPHIGTYGQGTLRITNGAASPASTVALAIKPAESELVVPPQNSEDRRLSENSTDSSQESRSKFRKSLFVENNDDVNRARSQSPSSVPAGKSALETSPPADSGNEASRLSTSPSDPQSRRLRTQRMSLFPQEVTADSNDLFEDGLETPNRLREFAARLSAVLDIEDDAVAPTTETFADTLLRLTGSPVLEPTTSESDTKEPKSEEKTRRAADARRWGRLPKKADSGYNADTVEKFLQSTPILSTAHRASTENEDSPASDNKQSTPITEEKETRKSHSAPQPSTPLYSQSCADVSTPSSSDKKRRSPLSILNLRNRSSKNKSFVLLNVQAGSRPSVAAKPLVSPLSVMSEAGRSAKRLQKPAPERVRQQWRLRNENADFFDGDMPTDREMQSGGNTETGLDGDVPKASTDLPSPRIFGGASGMGSALRNRGKSIGAAFSKPRTLELGPDTRPSFTAPRHSRSFTATAINRTPTKGRKIPSTEAKDQSKTEEQAVDKPDNVVDADAEVVTSTALPSMQLDDAADRSPTSSEPTLVDSDSPESKVVETNTEPEPEVQQPSVDEEEKRGRPTTSRQNSAQDTSRLIPIGARKSVEDLYPDWQGRPATIVAPPPESPPSTLPQVGYAAWNQSAFEEGIPPLPELPADIESKVSKSDEMLAKRMKNSPRLSPMTAKFPSARNSPKAASFSSAQSSPTRLPRSSGESQRSNRQGRSIPRHREEGLNTRRSALKQTSSSDEDDERDLMEKEVVTDEDQILRHGRWSIDVSRPRDDVEAHARTAPIDVNAQDPTWPGSDGRDDAWRKRRSGFVGAPQNLSISVIKAQATSDPIIHSAPLRTMSSPQIVVSRCPAVELPPSTSELNNASDKYSASSRAEAYQSLLSEDKENIQPKEDISMPRMDSLFSSPSSLAELPSHSDIPDSTTSSSTSTATQTTPPTPSPLAARRGRSKTLTAHTSRSTPELVRSASSTTTSPTATFTTATPRMSMSPFQAYRPTDAVTAERSRAMSFARRGSGGLA